LGPPAIRPFVPVIEAAAGEAAPVRLAPAAEISTDDTGGTEPAPATPRHIGSAVAATEMPVPAEPPAPARSGLPDIVARLMSRGTPVVGQSGDRITTLQIGSAAFFGSGSAALSNSGKAILSDVSVTLESREFASYHITIEGHTDDTPISTAQFQSNWELSAARAAAVARFLLELGVPARRLTASGFADTVPIVPNRNADGTIIAENQARNRRVVIRLEKIDKAER
jgi:flagellar motor protein MotB